jgi:hypothetical protein
VGAEIVIFQSVEDAIQNDPAALFERHGVLVIEGLKWATDLKLLSDNKLDQFKAFKEPQSSDPLPANAMDELNRLYDEMAALLIRLYGSYAAAGVFKDCTIGKSIRRMRTGPEPIHLDSFDSSNVPQILAFVNFDVNPRLWQISYTLPELVDCHKPLVQKIVSANVHNETQFNIVLRNEIVDGALSNIPFEEIDLSHGTFWVVNAKTVLHGVKYGAGAALWAVNSSKLPPGLTQKEILAPLGASW